MKPLCLPGALVILLTLTAFLAADDKVDFTQPQTPAKPAPAWLKIIDQGERDPRLKGYKTPEGIKLEIICEAPTVVNPVGMTFAVDGTPHVLEWRPDPGASFPEVKETFTYKDGSIRKVATMKKHVKDVVKVLKDSKGNSTYDEARVLLEDELPSSILLHDGWLYLSGRGTVRRFKQSKPGGAYDVKEVIAQGFCGFHHHQVSGLTIGPDGLLYITAGDDDNFVEGSDGSRATVPRTGAVFRCRPDGSKMETYSIGYRNPYRDVAFDLAGNIFHADNDNEDGSKFTGCRLMHVAEGTDFGWRLRFGARCCVPDQVRGAIFGELPGKVPPMVKTGRGAPAGLLIYNDSRFPEAYQGLLFYPDVFRKLIRAYKVERVGSTFQVVEEFAFLKSDDPLFRPCQMVVGPDGAMYIVDWRTDSGGAGRLWGDGKNGRIYRVTWSGTKEDPAIAPRSMDSWAKIGKTSDEELLKMLASPDASDRFQAQQVLRTRGDKNRAALLRVLGRGDEVEHARFAALGVLYSFWNADVQKMCEGVLSTGGADLRRLCAEALGMNAAPGDKDVHATLLKALADPDQSVRRAVALAMSRLGSAAAAENLVNTLAFDDGKDVYLRDGLVRAIEGVGKPGMERLLALADSGVQKDLDRVVDTFAALRTRPAAEALPTLLKNPHLSIEQRATLIRSCNNYLFDPPLSLDPVLDYLIANPQEAVQVKLAGLAVLSSGGITKGEAAAAWLLSLLDETHMEVRVATIKAIEEMRLAKAASKLAALVDASHPTKERLAAIKALRVLNDRTAVAKLQEIIAINAETPEDRNLRLEAFRTLAALDLAAASPTARTFLEGKDEALRKEAVLLLGATVEGARIVGKLFLEGKLPRELLPQVSDALGKHAGRDQQLAGLYADVIKSGLLVANNPQEAARMRKLVTEKGNPMRGRALYLNSKTLACINCHRLEGIGGAVGPDLTRSWDTQSIEKIMEAVLEPSKEIKEGFQSYVATTTKGQVFTGLKILENADEVILRDAEGRDIRLARKDIEELTASKKSLMPDNVISQLNYAQLIDLVAFLKDRKAQESLRGLVLEYHVVGPFGSELKKAYPPESKTDPKETYPGQPGQVLKWQPAQAEPNGLLNLGAIFKAERTSAYALTYVYAPKGQQADLLLGSGGTVRIWLNGKLVHEHALPRRAGPEEDRVPVSLQEGWNILLAKVVNNDKEQGLYLRFAGDGLRIARNPVEDKLPDPKR